MNFRPFLPASSVLALGLLCAPVAVQAASVTVEVSATVVDGCEFSDTGTLAPHALNLGMVHSISAQNFTSSKGIKYRCAAGSGYTISLSAGGITNALVGSGSMPRSMVAASGKTGLTSPSAVLPYTLTWVAPTNLSGEGFDPNATEHEVSFSATLDPRDTRNVPAGTYKETLVLTIAPAQ